MKRDLTNVLYDILTFVPKEQKDLEIRLKSHIHNERYRAPECQDWNSVAETLELFLQTELSKYWAIQILKVWRNE